MLCQRGRRRSDVRFIPKSLNVRKGMDVALRLGIPFMEISSLKESNMAQKHEIKKMKNEKKGEESTRPLFF